MNDNEARVRSLERATLRAIEQMMRLRKENEKLKAENERLSEENRTLRADLRAAVMPNGFIGRLLFNVTGVTQTIRKLAYEIESKEEELNKWLKEYIHSQSTANDGMRLLNDLTDRHMEVTAELTKGAITAQSELRSMFQEALALPYLSKKAVSLTDNFRSLLDFAEAVEALVPSQSGENYLVEAILQYSRVVSLHIYSLVTSELLSISREAMKNGAVIASELLLQCQRDGKPDPNLIAMLPHYLFEEGGIFAGRRPSTIANSLETAIHFRRSGLKQKGYQAIYGTSERHVRDCENDLKAIEKIAKNGEVAAESEDQDDDPQ